MHVRSGKAAANNSAAEQQQRAAAGTGAEHALRENRNSGLKGSGHPQLDEPQPSVYSATLVGGNLLKAKEKHAAVLPSRVMRAAAEKHEAEVRGLREELAQAERKINDLLEKQALAQERMKELEMARAADVKKLRGELDTAVENAAVAQREAQAFEAELEEVRDLLAKTESNRALEAVGQWAANTNVDGADGGGETKGETGRASSRKGFEEERNSDPSLSKSIVGTRVPSTLESRILMVQGLVRSKNGTVTGRVNETLVYAYTAAAVRL
jgi:hypothetical protein